MGGAVSQSPEGGAEKQGAASQALAKAVATSAPRAAPLVPFEQSGAAVAKERPLPAASSASGGVLSCPSLSELTDACGAVVLLSGTACKRAVWAEICATMTPEALPCTLSWLLSILPWLLHILPAVPCSSLSGGNEWPSCDSWDAYQQFCVRSGRSLHEVRTTVFCVSLSV